MKLLKLMLGLATGLFLIIILLGSINTLFHLRLVLRISGARTSLPDSWEEIFALIATAMVFFILFLISGSSWFSTRFKIFLLILIPLLCVGGMIISYFIATNKYNEFYKSAEKKLRANDYQGAISDYDKAIQLDGKEFYYYLRRGQIKEDNDNLDAALLDYNKAIALKPGDGWLYFIRALVEDKMMDPEKACEDYKKAVALGNENAKEDAMRCK